ncbi:hypothetical protein ZTR_06136 [Talaromyces verruculosus]|nr:hypothetical protein ZTR_06136 [Talaromyces verruculosus]
MASTRKTRKFLSFRFLFLLFFIGIDYLPSRIYTSSSELSSRSSLGIGVLADVVLMSTFVEVTQTVPPPPAATAPPSAAAAPAPALDGNAPAVQATDPAAATATATATAAVATNTAIGASVTPSGVDGSQATASGGGEQAMVQVPATTIAAAATETPTVGAASPPTNSGQVQVSSLADGKTSFVSIPTAPSGITTSIRGKPSPTATSTPSPNSTSTSTSTSSTQKFPTYAAGLASGTAIIAAAGGFIAFYLVRRSNRRYRPRRKPSPVNEIGQVSNNNNNRPFSIGKVSEVMSMANLSHKPCGDGNKLTSMKPPPDIDPETSWPRGYVPPDPEELRERMDNEKRRSSGSREGFDSAVDLGIGYVSSAGSGAGATPGDKRDGYFDGYDGHGPVQARPLSEVSMPEHMKPFMTPLQPRHNTQGFVPEPVDRAGAVSPAASSIYSRDFSRRESIVTSFGEIHAKIDGNSNFNAHREEYRLRKEQARQFGTYDYVEEEEESHDGGWREQDRSLEGSERPEVVGVDEYSSPYTAQRSTASPVNDYFSMQHHTANQERGGIGQHDDYFSTHHSVVNPDNRESQYEDIDLSQSDPYAGSQNDPYTEETTNSNKRNSGGYFGRFFGRGSGR